MISVPTTASRIQTRAARNSRNGLHVQAGHQFLVSNDVQPGELLPDRLSQWRAKIAGCQYQRQLSRGWQIGDFAANTIEDLIQFFFVQCS